MNFGKITEETEDYARSLEKGGDNFVAGMSGAEKKQKVLAKGFGGMAEAIKTGLNDPLVQGALGLKGMLFVFNKLKQGFLGADKNTSLLAKNLNMSADQAHDLNRGFMASSKGSGQLFVSSTGLVETLSEINSELGTSVVLNQDQIETMTKLKKTAGLTGGEMMGEKDLLKDIGKISAATTLSLGKNPALIADAVATTKALGMEMSKVDAIAGSLLDFESSIENELSAELLLNKDLNLEKARQYALNNDLAGVAREISEQAGSAAEFTAMNRIQQEALAKAVGMGREDLAKTLFVQEQLAGATGDQAAETEALLNKRIEAVGLEQAQKELAEKGIEGLRQQVGQADKIAASTERINEIFGMIGESMMPVFEMFGGILEIVGLIIHPFMLLMELTGKIGEGISNLTGPLGTVGKIMKGIVGIAVVLAAYMAFQSAAAIPVVGWVLGPIAAAAVLAAGFGALSKVGDMNSPADGKTQVSTKEGGLFELSKNDDLIAAPGASKMMQGGQSTQTVQNNTVVENKTDMSATNALLAQLIKKTPEMAPLGMYEIQ
jgi:hypothetical protein